MLSSDKAIGDVLGNDSTVKSIVAEISTGVYAVFAQNPMPKSYETLTPSINYYRSDSNAVLNWHIDARYTINCWADTYQEAQQLQEAVSSAFNRTSYSDFEDFQADIFPVIGITEDGTYYNGLVEVRARANKNILN